MSTNYAGKPSPPAPLPRAGEGSYCKRSLLVGWIVATMLSAPLSAQDASNGQTPNGQTDEQKALADLCTRIGQQPETTTEAEVIGAVDRAAALGQPFAVAHPLRLYLASHPTNSAVLQKKAIDNAMMTGDFNTAMVRCKGYLGDAKPGKEASEVAATLYRLQIDLLGGPNDAYRSMSSETDKLCKGIDARKFDAWYLDQARKRNDNVNVARRLAQIHTSGLPSVQTQRFYRRDVGTLLDSVRITSTANFATVEHLKKLSDAIRDDERMKRRCAFYAANLEYRALANGKSQQQRDKEFAPVLAAANTYLAKFPTADTLYDVMTVVCFDENGRFSGELLKEEQQGLFKRDFFVAAMGRLSEQERKDILTRQYANSFADTPQWMELAAKYPTAFRGCPQIDSFPFDMRCKTVAEYKRLAAAFEGSNSQKAAIVRAMAAVTPSHSGDFQACINHFITRESWNLDSYNRPHSIVTRELWTAFSSLERAEDDKLPGNYQNEALLKFGADHIVDTPLAMDPSTTGDYLRRVWSSLSREESDPAPMVACLDSVAWVPYSENDRKTAFEQVYGQFVAWTRSTRQRETDRKKELTDAQNAVKQSTAAIAKLKQDLAKTDPGKDKGTFDSLKKQLADTEKTLKQAATKQTTATERLAMVTKQVGQVSGWESAFKRVMNPRSPGAGKAPNALCEALAQTVKAVQTKNQRALVAAARKLYPMVKDYDTRKPPLGRTVFKFLFSLPQGIDVFEFQIEALTDRLSRFDPKSKTTEERLRTVADAIFANPKWSGGFLAEDKDKALALNALFAKTLATQISRGGFSPLLFDYVRRTRRGTGWGTSDEEIQLNQELVEQMVRRNVLAQSKWRPSGVFESKLRRCSHWLAKLVASDEAFSSASMRRTCDRRTSGLRSSPRSAVANSSWSGMELQRKNDSREASSRSLILYGLLDAMLPGAGSRSILKRKCGLVRIALIAVSIPVSKPSCWLASRKNFMGLFRSSSLTDRR